MSNFKIVFIGIFILVAVVGVLSFAGVINFGGSSSSTKVQGSAVIWGTLDDRSMRDIVADFNLRNQDINITYIQKNSATFTQDLTEAIASGSAPDLVIIPDNTLWQLGNKLTHIPYTSLPQRTFTDTFISGANIFLASDGVLGIPWAADPLVMYYNRDLLEGTGIATAPTSWQSFADTTATLTKRQSDLSLIQSGAAMGTYKNIGHAADIIAVLFMQSGNPFITTGTNGVTPHFGTVADTNENTAAITAMNFYMAFSNPVKNVYSWNAGQMNDRNAFVTGRLAYYFGTASELPSIQLQNPNLHFDIAELPQTPGSTPVTTGRIYGLAIPKAAPNQLLSYTTATLFANADSAKSLVNKGSTTLALIPARRDILAQKPASDPYLSLLYSATLVLRPWLDPSPAISGPILSTLVSDISSGILTTDQALTKAGAQLLTLGNK